MMQGGHLVFVVDDRTVIAETLATILTNSGFRAMAFDDPEIALSAAKINHPDVLISDVIMPRMTGIELAIHVRNVHSECRVLLISGEIATASLLEQTKIDGHNFDILPKPVHPVAILERLQGLISATNA